MSTNTVCKLWLYTWKLNNIYDCGRQKIAPPKEIQVLIFRIWIYYITLQREIKVTDVIKVAN